MTESPSQRTPRGVTIQEVAAHAGVAPMTVSRALNGGYVSESKRELVLRAVEELGYRPHFGARHMKSGKSHQVGVLLRNNSRVSPEETGAHALAFGLVLGVSEGLEEAGYMMSFVRISDVIPEKHVQDSAFQGHLLDGLIVLNYVPALSVERIETTMKNCIWVDGPIWKGNGCVRRDEFHAGYIVGQELASLGYREWILLHRDPLVGADGSEHYSTQERIDGVQKAAVESGATLRVMSMEPFEQFKPHLHSKVAVIAHNAYVAYDLLHQATEGGLLIGRDFALACCDDGHHVGGHDWPQLARVSFDRFHMGFRAARLMINQLNGSQETTSELIRGVWIGGSTALPCPS